MGPAASVEVLGPGGEAQWSRLRRYLELASGFWLGFLFSSSPVAVTMLRRRTEQMLRLRGLGLTRVAPEEVAHLLPALLRLSPRDSACIWIELLQWDARPDGGARSPWREASTTFLLRLNEHREALRRRGVGLMLALACEMKAPVREAAPDLWIKRSLVLELPLVRGAGRPTGPDRVESPGRGPEPGPSPDPDFALAEARRRSERGRDPRPVAAALLRAVQGMLAAGRSPEAITAAMEAVERLRSIPAAGWPNLAEALAWLSRAEAADGDRVAAGQHLDEALRLRRSAGWPPLEWLDEAGKLALAGADVLGARALYGEALAIAERLAAQDPANAAWQRDLSVSHELMGDVLVALGDLAGALAAYRAALAIRERVAAQDPANAAWQRDLSVSGLRIAGLIDTATPEGHEPAPAP